MSVEYFQEVSVLKTKLSSVAIQVYALVSVCCYFHTVRFIITTVLLFAAAIVHLNTYKTVFDIAFLSRSEVHSEPCEKNIYDPKHLCVKDLFKVTVSWEEIRTCTLNITG